MLGEKVFRITDNLSRALQAEALSACDARGLAHSVVAVLESLRTDERFNSFKAEVDSTSVNLRKSPKHIVYSLPFAVSYAVVLML